MIEGVNSVLTSAPLVRVATEQQSAARSFAANPDRVQEVAQAPYVDSIGFVPEYDQAILFLRDGQTGDTIQQIPSQEGLELRRRQEAARQEAILAAQSKNDERRAVNNAPATSNAASTASSIGVSGLAGNVSFVSSAPASASQNVAPITQAVLSAFASGAQTAQPAPSAGVNVSA